MKLSVPGRLTRRFNLILVAPLLAILLAGCAVPERPIGQVDNAAAAVGQLYVGSEMARIKAAIPLEPRPSGSPQAIAEAYMQRFQPGPTPRIFQNTLVYDRQGRLMADLFDEGRRTWAPLDRIAPFLLKAIIATEDGSFYRNSGVDERRLVGVVAQGLLAGDLASGASTITMQLVRNLLLPPDARFDRSIDRKVSELLLARELTKLFTKDELLEMYLNLAYFGHLAYGPEAAAQTYFGKPASDLTLAEASLLAGLVQRPATLDPFINPGGAKARQQTVLSLMVRRSYITQAEADAAYAEPLQLAEDPNLRTVLAPHFLQYLNDYLAQPARNLNLLRAGLRIRTTLDLDLQDFAQGIVRAQVDKLRAGFNLNNASLVALKVGTAEVVAMVGSADFDSAAIGGQVNVTLRKRQPGSAIKPVVYAAALDTDAVSPASVLWDVRVEYPIGDDRTYVPQNYDERFRGPVTVRTALANSLNIPTLKLFDALEPEQFLATANRMGVAFTAEGLQNAGLSASLGALEVSPLELTTAYHTLANGGRFVEPTPVLSVTDGLGRPLTLPVTLAPQQAVSPDTAFLVTDILSDNAARASVFGEASRLRLSRPAAAKTGTTTDFRDNWTVGYTRYLAAGVWSGNNDGQPMRGVDGITGAGPIWNQFMEGVIADPALRAVIGAPEDEAAWAFEPTPGVSQVAAACPGPLYCRSGGEYFSYDWLLETAALGGPYAGSFAAGVMAGVDVELADGSHIMPGVCVQSYTAGGDPTAQVALALPLGVGRLAMRTTVPTFAAAGNVDANDSEVDAPTQPTLPIAARGLPLVNTRSAPAVTTAPLTLGRSDPTVYRERSERLADQQAEARNWALNNGRWLALGPCSEMEALTAAMYPNRRSVALVTPPPPPPVVITDTVAAETAETASPGSVGAFVSPAAGATVAGVIPIVGIADHPAFVKWQLDLMIFGGQETFLAVGDWRAPQPTQLYTWDTALYPNGDHLLRLRVVRSDYNYDEYFAPVTIGN
jgi:penicillin-binding protein 1C